MESPSLLLLLVLAASMFSVRSECPSEEDIFPCECIVDLRTGSMKVTCEDSRTTLNEVKSALSYFSKEEEIFALALVNLNLGTIPSNLFEGISAKELRISNCEIDFENGKPPLKGLEDSLQDLYLMSSLTQKNVPLNLKFGHLKELKTLMLFNNKITELRDYMFEDEMPNLFSLDLIDNSIEKIGESVFKNLKNVQLFSLSGNKFGSLRRNMVPTPSTRLSQLWLGNNGLTDLQDDIFTSMPGLTIISLYNNEIKTLNRTTWETILDRVYAVGLSENPLQCDSEMEWLFKKKVSHKFAGTCAGPEGKEGLSFEEFLKQGEN